MKMKRIEKPYEKRQKKREGKTSGDQKRENQSAQKLFDDGPFVRNEKCKEKEKL